MIKKCLLVWLTVLLLPAGCAAQTAKTSSALPENMDITVFFGLSSYAMFGGEQEQIEKILSQFQSLKFKKTDKQLDFSTAFMVSISSGGQKLAGFSVDKNGVFTVNDTAYVIRSGKFDYDYLKQVYEDSKHRPPQDSLPDASPSVIMNASEDGVADFLKIKTDFMSAYKNDQCFNVTSGDVLLNSEYRVFKYSLSCESFLLYENKVYQLGTGFGGSGITSMALADINNDNKQELYFTFSWGSGIHRSQVGYFDPTASSVVICENSAIMNKDTVLVKDTNNLCVYSADIQIKSFVDLELAPKDMVFQIGLKDNKITVLPV